RFSFRAVGCRAGSWTGARTLVAGCWRPGSGPPGAALEPERASAKLVLLRGAEGHSLPRLAARSVRSVPAARGRAAGTVACSATTALITTRNSGYSQPPFGALNTQPLPRCTH